MTSKPAAFCLSLLALMSAPPAAAQPVQLSDQRLYDAGLRGYIQGNCVTATRYWFAYLQRNPAELQSNIGKLNRIERVIGACESAPSTYAAYNVAMFYVSQPTHEQRCRTYGELAAAQYEVAQAANCGFSGSRWSPDIAYHANWCMTVDHPAVSAEHAARNHLLEQCSPSK
ncbi:MAG TPA: hypothetical protein VFW48_07825 [Solirubrobacterales bacterium]|nr:hypothetical protein [Solirubrobacterales bacterium]